MKPLLAFKKVCDLPRSCQNPRNSEGDFAVLKDGSILFAYSRYHGSSNHDDASCDIAGLLSKDGGESFAPLGHLLAKAASHDTQNIMSVSLLRLKDQTLCLLYLAKFGRKSALFLRRATGDAQDETVFGEAELVLKETEETYYIINNSRVHLLPDGRLLLPVAHHPIEKKEDGSLVSNYYASARIYVYDPDSRKTEPFSPLLTMRALDGGKTGLQEPGVYRLKDGRLCAYFRTDRAFQYHCFADENGQGWTQPKPSPFTSPTSPMLIRQNPYSGKFYAVWNPIPEYNGRLDASARWIHAGRTPFVLAESDDGLDFSPYIVLENEPDHGYCYPAICFLDAQTLLLSYCAGGPQDDMCLTRTVIRKVRLHG